MSSRLKTISEGAISRHMNAGTVIDELGGTTRVAIICQVRPSAVSNWRKLGKFPPRVRSSIEDAYSEKCGVTLDRAVFAEVSNAERGDKLLVLTKEGFELCLSARSFDPP